MLDPIARYEMDKKEQIYIRKKYPVFYSLNEFNIKEDIAQFNVRPRLGIGVATIPKICGCGIKYEDHMNPFAKPLLTPDEDPLTLKEPDYDNEIQWLYDEIDEFKDIGFKGLDINLPDLQGPLNVSMKLVGDKRMLGLIARKNKKDVVKHILDVASDVYIEVSKRLKEATGRPVKSNWSVSGCTYYYINPKKWTEYIIPIIKKCQRVLGNGTRLHHCGLADTKKMETYAQHKWNSLEFGFGSDLKTARKLFDDPKLGPLPISCRISPFRMLNQSSKQITKDVEWIIENVKGGPASISVVGIPHNTPEENLWALWNAVQAYNKKKEEEEDEDD